jgi:SAM-dependent methyltransferase
MSALEFCVLLGGAGLVGLLFYGLLYERVRFYWAKLSLTVFGPSRPVWASRGDRKAAPPEPTLGPYERLAELWHEHSTASRPDYAAFLPALARRYRHPIDAVLDLACGAGTLTAQLAGRFRQVAGVDVSGPMLERARAHCAALANVRLVRADFRRFDLPDRFDAAVCACDSLNYIEHPGDLALVLRCVGRHLRPGGFFVFDVLGGLGFQALSGVRARFRVGETWFDLSHHYDPKARVEESRVVFDSGVERHRRIPIEKDDVATAAEDSGFEVVDTFSGDNLRIFYVLRKTEPAAGPR